MTGRTRTRRPERQEQNHDASLIGNRPPSSPPSSLPPHELGVPAIPRALTPSEVEAAWQAAAALVKLFPASLGGARYVNDLLAPLADVPLIVTGGVGADNARAFLDAGAVAVGVGSSLAGDPAAAARLVAALRD